MHITKKEKSTHKMKHMKSKVLNQVSVIPLLCPKIFQKASIAELEVEREAEKSRNHADMIMEPQDQVSKEHLRMVYDYSISVI